MRSRSAVLSAEKGVIREFLRRLAYNFQQRRFEEELDEEIRHHHALPPGAEAVLGV